MTAADKTVGFLLPELARPAPDAQGLDQAYWQALRDEILVVQRCISCRRWQWGPLWICSHCHSFELSWEEVPAPSGCYVGEIYSWERVWHPTTPALAGHTPYTVVLIALPSAGGVRMIGNLTADRDTRVTIGALVTAVFEHHELFTLVHWRLVR